MDKSVLYDLSIVVPCYNEEGNVTALCERLEKVFDKYKIAGEIIFVNDGSIDNTASTIEELSTKYHNVKSIHHKINQGMEAGWRTGVENSAGEYICFIDADLQYLPEEVWRLYREIRYDSYDLVQGTRSSIGRIKDPRYLLSKSLNILLNILFGMRAKDNKSGFIITRREKIQDILKHRFKYYYFQTFITVSAYVKGYRIGEVETLFQSRYLGHSFINRFPFKLIAKVILDLIKGFIEYRILEHRIDSTESIITHYADKIPVKKIYEGYNFWQRIWMEFYFLTFPIHKWKITSKTKYFYSALQRTQWLTSEEINNLQSERLIRLLRHTIIHVPYYRNKFKELGINIDEIKSIADLTRIPLLSKQDVRDNLYFDLFADNHRKSDMLPISTSGSTGEPFITYADRTQLEMRWATTLRALGWTGWKPGKRQLRLWHQNIGMTKSQVIRERTDAFIMRREFIPAYEMDTQLISHMFETIKKHKPYLIDGYAESFNFLAHYVLKNNLSDVKVPAMMSSAQTLNEDTRKIIEQAFQTKLYDKYGSREFSGIAYECRHGEGYHIMAESYIVEVVKDGKPVQPGELGEIVITDLNNYSTPLIRYRIGDMGILHNQSHKCTCGRYLPMIAKIEGRVQSMVQCLNGKYLPGTFFSHIFKEYHFAIRQYQIIQHKLDQIEIKIVPESQYDKYVEDELIKDLGHYVGSSMKIEVTKTKNIPLTKTGKRLSVISKLNLDLQKNDSE